MKDQAGTFRFTYFTDIYNDTISFYKDKLMFEIAHSWDRSEDDKGALFNIGQGVIEVLKRPTDPSNTYPALDYRTPQGVFTGIQVWDIDKLFHSYKAKGIPFKEEIISHPWGHRSFYVLEPNGLVLGFYQEQF